jgi:hypothetical protein
MTTCTATTAVGNPCNNHAMEGFPNPNMLQHVFVKSSAEFIR